MSDFTNERERIASFLEVTFDLPYLPCRNAKEKLMDLTAEKKNEILKNERFAVFSSSLHYPCFTISLTLC